MMAALQPYYRSMRRKILMILSVVRWLKHRFINFLLSSFEDFLKPSILPFSVVKAVLTGIRGLLAFSPTKRSSSSNGLGLPDATSPKLHLSHPTDEENLSTWTLTSDAWRDALTIPQYLEESSYLMTIPLAKDGGMTQWVLVDKTLPANQRPLLASCETFLKRSLVSDKDGNVTETITHGVASVYCDLRYRRHGYASRLMRELREVLQSWQVDEESNRRVVARVLFSDIGTKFYAAVGWHPFASFHIELDAARIEYTRAKASPILAEHVGQLCEEDEAISRKAMARSQTYRKTRFMILPDHDHMLWHHRKEEFACHKLFGKQPHVKGAIAGLSGNRVWAVWTHRFYEHPEEAKAKSSDNTLYVLCLVVENQMVLESSMNAGTLLEANIPTKEFKMVLEAAQAEAMQWDLPRVNLWGPSPLVERLIHKTGLKYRREDRDEESICSLHWYGEGGGQDDILDWVGNEKYGWC